MRPVALVCLAWLAALGPLACNGGATAPKRTQAEADADPEPGPDDTSPPRDAAAPRPEDDAGEPEPPAPDADPPVTVDAPTVVTPTGPGPDTTVTAFPGAHVYWKGGMDNKRTLDAVVKFPDAALLYEKITLTLALRCPVGGRCDFWDRRAYLGVVRKVGDKESVTEILRFMTPYGVPVTHTVDVTALRPLLAGEVTMRVFIDTWVGPGHQQGDGWLVEATFDMKGGMPARRPIAVLPLWDEMRFDYGDPAKPVAAAVTPRSVTIPAGAGAVELRAMITGHGQGNLDNCAEFCRRNHAFRAGGMRVERLVWRDNCSMTGLPQNGTWRTPRAGWCPGTEVAPWVADISAAAPAGQAVTISYEVAPYVNSCRPDAPVCGGCALRTSCAYDNGNHTTPFYAFSALLVVYAP